MNQAQITMAIMSIILVAFFILFTIAGLKKIGPTERGLLVVLGQWRGIYYPGTKLVFPPFGSKVIKIDLSDSNWKNKLSENREKIPMPLSKFKELEKLLEEDAIEIQQRSQKVNF